MICVDEVDVVGKPADGKYDDNGDEHFDHLSFGGEFPLVGLVVAVVLSDDGLGTPEDSADPTVADGHRRDRDYVRQRKEHYVIAGKK